MACTHCQDTGSCPCIACLGRCVVCPARAKWAELGPLLDARGIDIRDAQHWQFKRPEAPAKPYRVFLPEVAFDLWKAKRKAA